MSSRRRPRTAELSEIVIERGTTAVSIEFVDGSSPGTHLELGRDVHEMTDVEVLESYNKVVEAMEWSRATYEHIAVEVPVGKPQVRYSLACDQWVPRGDVVRCVVEHVGGDEGVRILIDEHELSLEEFGGLLGTYAGWGMRVTFVPDDRLETIPVVEVRDPDDAWDD